MKKIDGNTPDLTKENIQMLKNIFPEVVTDGKIDFDQLKLLLGEEVAEKEKYRLTWFGKGKSLKLSQTPSQSTLRPDKDSSKNWDQTENLYIEGDNLEVLKLLQKSYFGKIKMIYIDPPYNTGHDFVYKDRFKERESTYKEKTGQHYQINSETDGRYHTNWLNMMYPRLRLARNLLSEEGVIFVSIDYHELHNLIHMMNEIFGEENYRDQIIIRRGVKSVQAQFETVDSLSSGYEFVLVYTKNRHFRFNKVYETLKEEKKGTWNNHWRGTDRPTMRYELFGIKPSTGQWRWSKERSMRAIENYKEMVRYFEQKGIDITDENIDKWYEQERKKGREPFDLLRLSKNGKPEHYIPPTNKKLLSNLWTDLKPNGSSQLAKLFDNKVFDMPKSIDLIKRLIQFCEGDKNKKEIILDFFSGSGTTAHAVMDLNGEDGGNRKFIMVQLPERTDEKSEAYKAGFKTISEIGKERIRRAGEQIVKKTGNKDLDIGFKVFRLDTSNVKTWDPYTNQIEQDLFSLTNNIKEDRSDEDLLYEILLKIGKPLTSKIEKINIEDKIIFNVEDGKVLLCLENEIDSKVAKQMVMFKKEGIKPKVIFKETGFMNDAEKTNTVQTLKKHGITDIWCV